MFTIFSKIQFLSDQLFDLTYQLEGHFMRKYWKKAVQKRLIVIKKIGEVSILNHDECMCTNQHEMYEGIRESVLCL